MLGLAHKIPDRLPLQVFASGGMEHCMSMQMPLSHATGESPTFNTDAVGVAQPESASAAFNGCGGSARGNQSPDCSADHCAAVTGCGIAAAFVPALPLVMPVPADSVRAISPPSLRVGFLTDAPERPPRTTA